MSYYYSIDGPEISPGPKDHYVLSGDSVSLICGYNLNSYPPAVISWTSPHGDAVRSRSGSKYSMDNGPGVVRLNISDVTESLGGEWTCQVEVFDSDVLKVEEGRLIRDINTTIGRQTFPTYLHVLGKCEQYCSLHNNGDIYTTMSLYLFTLPLYMQFVPAHHSI